MPNKVVDWTPVPVPANEICVGVELPKADVEAVSNTGRADDKWCASSYPIDRLALADVRKGIEGLQQTFNKQKPRSRSCYRRSRCSSGSSKRWRTPHNKSMQNAVTH